jgi:hypothetical protein
MDCYIWGSRFNTVLEIFFIDSHRKILFRFQEL